MDADSAGGAGAGQDDGLDLAGPLLLVGAGKMGGAMLTGWLERGLDPALVHVLDPGPPPEVSAILDKFGITAHTEIAQMQTVPAIIIMAVKPQMMDAVFAKVAPLAGPGTLILSIAAGRKIASFEALLGSDHAVVRSIPNTPAAIGRGITVCAANAHVSAKQKALCTTLLEAVGAVDWVADEALIDAVTAVSGSGPAYVFALAECLAEAGIAAGLDQALAQRLARVTVSGAGELLHQSADSAAILRQNVTSPGGTTAAALDVLMPHLAGERDKMADAGIQASGESGDPANASGLRELMTEAVAAATMRARELSS